VNLCYYCKNLNPNAVIASESSCDKLMDIYQLIQQLQQLNSKIPRQHRILRQLMYSSINSREESIHTAEIGTCAWIFEDANEISKQDRNRVEDEDSRNKRKEVTSVNDQVEEMNLDGSSGNTNKSRASNIEYEKRQGEMYQKCLSLRKTASVQFISWLRSGNGIFHISGKAGSGKSTLMKYIRHNARTTHELKQWSGSKKLVQAYFYFSNTTGDESQMSLDSLYRSILLECLTQCPELISEVFPHQWRSFNAIHGDKLLESNEFTPSKIVDAFNILTSSRLDPSYKFCFLY
jgi:ATPase subunit of ABC transporter with duplicated ATPase domains